MNKFVSRYLKSSRYILFLLALFQNKTLELTQKYIYFKLTTN